MPEEGSSDRESLPSDRAPGCEDEGQGGRSTKSGDPSLIFWRWLRAFGPFAFILLLDPFGCARQAKLYSENLVLRIAAPFHGVAHHVAHGADTEGQDKVLVVRIDQRSLEQISTDPSGRRATWPISRASQIQFILQPILETRPRAVFLDYTFNADSLPSDQLQPPCADEADKAGCKPSVTPESGPKSIGAGSTGVAAARDAQRPCQPSDASIRCAIEAAMAAAPGTRLFLGSKPTFENAVYRSRGGRECKVPRLTRKELGEAQDVATDLRHWSADSRVELVTLRNYDPNHYPLVSMAVSKAPEIECGEKGGDIDGYLASPAYAMFSVYCRENPSLRSSGNALCAAMERPPRPAVYPEDEGKIQPTYYLYGRPEKGEPVALVPYWPAFRTEWQRTFDRDLEDRGSPGDERGLATYLRRCNRTGTGLLARLGLSWVLFKTGLTQAETNEPCRYGVDSITLGELTTASIKPGRFILVGLDLADVPDPVANPLYPDTPGVMLHGVALENLITYGDHYVHDPGKMVGNLDKADLFTLLAGLLLSLPVMFRARFQRWGTWLARRGPQSTAGMLPPVLAVVLLTALWPPLALSIGLLLWLIVVMTYARLGSFGPLTVLVIAFAIVFATPFLLALTTFGLLHWALIDWLVLTAALSWAPEIAFEVLDEAWKGAPAPAPAAGRRRSPWFCDFWAPAGVVILAALLAGVFVRR